MSQSAVPHVVEPGKRSVPVTETTATVPSGECFSLLQEYLAGVSLEQGLHNLTRRIIMKIYVGNLSYEATEDELAAEFGTYGKVESVAIPADKYSGRPKGFAFVEMQTKSEAEAAIEGLNGKTFKDRTIVVNESRPRVDNRSGGYSGGRGGSYSGGGYGGSRGGRSGRGRQRRY
jgi:RNA recognition motif-containing protein